MQTRGVIKAPREKQKCMPCIYGEASVLSSDQIFKQITVAPERNLYTLLGNARKNKYVHALTYVYCMKVYLFNLKGCALPKDFSNSSHEFSGESLLQFLLILNSQNCTVKI